MKNVYLGLAIVGAVVPYIFFIDYFVESGIGLTSFTGSLFINGAAGGFAADVLISSAVFWVYIFSRSVNQKNGPAPWLYVALNLTIGLSCALPAYLYTLAKQAEAVPQPAT